MNILKRSLALLALGLALPLKSALAVCPVCTLAVAGGVGILEYYGVDDIISGLWVGALIVSVSMWTINYMNKKGWKFLFRKPLVFLIYYLATLWPLYSKHYLFGGKNYVWGMDRMLFGIILGTIVFSLGAVTYDLYKQKKGKALFPFQKVIQPVGFVAVATLVTYLLTSF